MRNLFSPKRGRTFLRAFLPALILAQVASATASREFLIRNWTREDGLPGNTVTALAQTPAGYLWVGTLAGLARFDGVRLVTINLEALAGVKDTFISCLFTDPQGTLWAGTEDGHLVRFDGTAFRAFSPPSGNTADRAIRRMAAGRDGSLWILSYEGRLNRLLAGGNFDDPADRSDFVGIASDSERELWIATRNQLMIAPPGGMTVLWSDAKEPKFSPEGLAPARAGGCWVADRTSVRRWSKGASIESRPLPPGKSQALSALTEDREGRVWLGTYGGGIFLCEKQGEARRLSREQGLPSDLVRCLLEDQEGNFWAGLEGKGLARIRRSTFLSYGRGEGLSGETVLCLAEGGPGEVWVGTNGDGVQRIRKDGIRHYSIADGLSNPFVWTLHSDKSGTLWAGTWGGGLFRKQGERFVPAGPSSASNAIVLTLYEDRERGLWAGGQVGHERLVLRLADGRCERFRLPGDGPRLDVTTMAQTSDGTMWIGTDQDGLLRRRNGSFEKCDSDPSFPRGPVTALHVDEEGGLWVAVSGFGLVLWENERFTPIPGSQVRTGTSVVYLADDGLGYLWCGSRTGVARVKKEHLRRVGRGERRGLEWQRFSSADGLPNNECSGVGCRTADERVWFATLAGVAVVDPHKVVVNQAVPPVLIEGIRLIGRSDSQHVDLARNSAGAEAQGDGTTPGAPVKIPPGAGQIEIAYTALSFTAPERVRFRYRLGGLSADPVEAGVSRLARYSYLPPGKYQFEVTACNEDGVWNPRWATLGFEVLPRFWQSWWFQLSGIAVVLASAAGAARWTTARRMRRRLTALEQQTALEKERSRIAQDLHDDLGTSLTEINFLAGMAGSPFSSPAEVKTSLEGINEKSLELVKALDEIVWAVNPRNDSLPNLVNYLCLFAQAFLRPAAIHCRLDVSPTLPDLPLNAEQRHTLFLATKEALANAAKHSGASELRLGVAFEQQALTLVIEDNGCGIELGAVRPGRNGLTNMASRMRHLGGTAAVKRAGPRGTRVELRVPLLGATVRG